MHLRYFLLVGGLGVDGLQIAQPISRLTDYGPALGRGVLPQRSGTDYMWRLVVVDGE
jgi:hypothetical protein